MSLLVSSVLSLLYDMGRDAEMPLLLLQKNLENPNRTNKNPTDIHYAYKAKGREGAVWLQVEESWENRASLNTQIDAYIKHYACISGTDLSVKE